MSTDSMSTETSLMAARLRQIQESDATILVPQPRRSALAAALEQASAAHVVVPVPRRARMFVRHGEGHGEFSDVTLTSPVRDSEEPSA